MALRRFTFCRLKTLRAFYYSTSSSPLAVDIEDGRVQNFLLQLTGMDFDKIFVERKEKLSLPKLKLLTEADLKQVYEDACIKAKKLLAMPPILPEREKRGKELGTDTCLDKFDDSKWIFTDISTGIDDKDRYIAVREPDGSLREATNEERDRLCQVYFPRPGRQIWLPKLLTKEELPFVLERGFHVHVLDLVCSQCPPDSSDYIRVHSTVYDDINKKRKYSELHCTKYYGTLIWHLLKLDDFQGIIEYTLNCERLDDAEALVQLYMLAYPSVKEEMKSFEGLSLIQEFCKYKRYNTVLQLLSLYNNQLSSSSTVSA